MRNVNIRNVIIFFSLALLGIPSVCHAFQTHPAPEGMYVHQMAHLLFVGALAYLYWHLGQGALLVSRGWYYLRLFCLLFLAWNLLTFAGHASYSYLTAEDFVNVGTWQAKLIMPLSLVKAIYYLARFEHLFSVPAIFFLFLSLSVFYREVCAEEAEKC